jgi:DNA-binding NtrC family response regulator
VDRVAKSDAKVLITGESGVGNEIVAQSIHSRGPRAGTTFAPVNCADCRKRCSSRALGHVRKLYRRLSGQTGQTRPRTWGRPFSTKSR